VYQQFLEGPLFYNAWSLIHFMPRCKAIQQIVKQKPRARILDLGCGTGLFKKYVPDCEYTGIDNNPAYIGYARKRLQGSFILGDIFDLQGHLGGRVFDFAVINGVLHHLDDALLVRLLGTLPGLLAPGGKVIIVDHIWSRDLNPVNRFLVQHDRGAFSRSEPAYRKLFKDFAIESFTTFTINAGPLVLWTQGRFVLSCPGNQGLS
jgi:SAM-dependent methyltransferase